MRRCQPEWQGPEMSDSQHRDWEKRLRHASPRQRLLRSGNEYATHQSSVPPGDCLEGVYKASIEGGSLVDPRVGRLVVGQDLMAGYASQDGVHCHLYLSESIVLMLEEPHAVCTMRTHLAGHQRT
jgi:hypothetical protein